MSDRRQKDKVCMDDKQVGEERGKERRKGEWNEREIGERKGSMVMERGERRQKGWVGGE